MLTSVRKRTVAVAATASVLAFGLSALPAAAQTQQQGLVNVALINNNVQVPVAVAANICDVSVNAISTGAVTSGGNCTAISSPSASGGGGGGGGGSTSQTGLVNIDVSNNNVQVPVGVAANICDVSANVITSGTFTTGGNCSSVTTPTATI
jgi:hypothetical protein